MLMTQAEKSTVIIDNTTFASAGRAIYHGDKRTDGGKHAEEYYQSYPDAVFLDKQSLAEFLTAFTLFDELLWDGSSCIQEVIEHNPDVSYIWIYDWFPQFKYAHQEGIIKHLSLKYGAVGGTVQ
jgi:hypothetical protein